MLNFHPVENSSDTAEIIVPKLIEMYNPQSVIDLGCNVGWWLYWFNIGAVEDVLGIDGDNMREKMILLKEEFISRDLTKPLILHRKFDLCLCLEVAEHLEEKYADTLVKTCVTHSDTIFWSAARPGQGGYHHVNEQEPEYWIEKFAFYGYRHRLLADVLPVVPHDYYRKNAIEFKR
jgi:hypothetical protein